MFTLPFPTIQYQDAGGAPLPPSDRLIAAYLQTGDFARRKLQAPNQGQLQTRTSTIAPWVPVAGT